MSRVRALALRIVRTFRHDRRTLGLLVVTPLVVMILIGYMVGDTGKENLRVGFLRPATVQQAAGFRTALAEQPGIDVVDVADSDAGRQQVADGALDGLVILTPGIRPTMGIQPTVVVPGVDVQIESPIVRAASLAAAEAQGQPVSGDVPGSSSSVSRCRRTFAPRRSPSRRPR